RSSTCAWMRNDSRPRRSISLWTSWSSESRKDSSMRTILACAALLALCGCAAVNYDLTVMPRDSGTLYQGVAEDRGGQGPISITIENKTYHGSWVQVEPERSYGYVSGG